jgi:hypothetical protein
MPVQGLSQTFRDGFTVGGMSQVVATEDACITIFLFIPLAKYIFSGSLGLLWR